jgi:hypothetical protein
LLISPLLSLSHTAADLRLLPPTPAGGSSADAGLPLWPASSPLARLLSSACTRPHATTTSIRHATCTRPARHGLTSSGTRRPAPPRPLPRQHATASASSSSPATARDGHATATRCRRRELATRCRRRELAPRVSCSGPPPPPRTTTPHRRKHPPPAPHGRPSPTIWSKPPWGTRGPDCFILFYLGTFV